MTSFPPGISDKKPIIAITMGDPGGIGPEIILKAHKEKALKKTLHPIVIGSLEALNLYKKKLKLDIPIFSYTDISDWQSSPNFQHEEETISLLCLPIEGDFKIGAPTKSGGLLAAQSIEKAVQLAQTKKIDAITTAPISKEGLNLAGYKFPGHTEMLASLTHTKDFAMMLASGDLRVVLTTIHMAIKDVSRSLSAEKIESLLRLINDQMHYFNIQKPKIAVTSLNPHAGEGGLFGKEEETVIAPAIIASQKKGIDAAGPFPADTLFVEQNRKQYDAVLVMYHDQGLIPLKMASFTKAVNITLGLPIIRTSVDHGTAYNITGKNMADPSSLMEALKVASQMALNQISAFGG